MLKKQQGFTLTEGVIALAIVGIIAVFTLPQMINSTNESGQIAKWKVGYQAASDILDLYMTDTN
ncbi:MAG: type II secretion system protein [Dolichospermum sp.]